MPELHDKKIREKIRHGQVPLSSFHLKGFERKGQTDCIYGLEVEHTTLDLTKKGEIFNPTNSSAQFSFKDRSTNVVKIKFLQMSP